MTSRRRKGLKILSYHKRYRGELIEIGKKIREAKEGSDFDVAESQTMKLFSSVIANKAPSCAPSGRTCDVSVKLRSIITDSVAAIDEKISQCQNGEVDIQQKITEKQAEISRDKREYEQLSENTGIEEYSELNSSLKQRVARFFRDFGIVREYDPANLETAFDIIAEEWRKLEFDLSAPKMLTGKRFPFTAKLQNISCRKIF